MKRVELALDLKNRLVMRACTYTLMVNIKSEFKKQINSDKPLTSSIGVDLGSIAWMGKSSDVTEKHTHHWLNMPGAFTLWQSYIEEIGNPEYILILKEPAVKQLIISDIVIERERIFGVNDDLKRTYGSLHEYYGDWTVSDLRTYLQDIKTRTS